MPQSTSLYEYNTSTTNQTDEYQIKHNNEKVATATVTNLEPGDTFAYDGKIYTYLGGADDSSGHQVGFFATAKNSSVHFFSFTQQSANATYTLDTSEGSTICFMAGTQVATPTGTAAIEQLSIGDLVLTNDGRTVPVLWIGRQTVSTRFADPLRVLPIRIKSGALGENVPTRDLLVSPCHGLLVDDVLVQAGALVNGSSIVRDANVRETFVYYHVELEDHALILAEGVPAETFVDNIDRMNFDNWKEHLELYPEGRAVQELPYPRAASARQVPAAIFDRLATLAQPFEQDVVDAA